MKKVVFLLMIVFAVIFITGCRFENVHFCPYCSSADVTEVKDGVYKCGNTACGKTFGAKEIADS